MKNNSFDTLGKYSKSPCSKFLQNMLKISTITCPPVSKELSDEEQKELEAKIEAKLKREVIRKLTNHKDGREETDELIINCETKEIEVELETIFNKNGKSKQITKRERYFPKKNSSEEGEKVKKNSSEEGEKVKKNIMNLSISEYYEKINYEEQCYDISKDLTSTNNNNFNQMLVFFVEQMRANGNVSFDEKGNVEIKNLAVLINPLELIAHGLCSNVKNAESKITTFLMELKKYEIGFYDNLEKARRDFPIHDETKRCDNGCFIICLNQKAVPLLKKMFEQCMLFPKCYGIFNSWEFSILWALSTYCRNTLESTARVSIDYILKYKMVDVETHNKAQKIENPIKNAIKGLNKISIDENLGFKISCISKEKMTKKNKKASWLEDTEVKIEYEEKSETAIFLQDLKNKREKAIEINKKKRKKK